MQICLVARLLSPRLLLILAAAWIIVSGALLVRGKLLYSGDEIISYLCATGHAAEYEQVLHEHPPYGEIVPAYQWKSFWQVNEPFCFHRIAADLCTNDLHPPLYFWLLHLAVWLLGVQIFTGILLNVLLQLCTLFVLHRLALRVSGRHDTAAFAALIWTINPASAMVSLHARPYELLALITVSYLLFFYQWTVKRNTANVLGMVLSGALGMLTHYSFLYVMGSAVLYALLKWRQLGLRNLVAGLLAPALSFGIMTLVHPCYADSFVLQQARRQAFGIAELPARILKSGLSLLQFAMPALSFKQPAFPATLLILLCIMLAGMLIVLVLFRNTLREAWNSLRQLTFKHAFFAQRTQLPVLLFVFLGAAVLLPYLFFITPFHAMGGQYLVYLYPLMALLCALFAERLSVHFRALVMSYMALGSACVFASLLYWNQASYANLIQQVREHELIVVTNTDRRAFPRFIPYLEDHQQILMDEHALARTDLPGTAFLLISGERDRQPGIDYTLYDTNDGVKFYAAAISAGSFSVPPPAK